MAGYVDPEEARMWRVIEQARGGTPPPEYGPLRPPVAAPGPQMNYPPSAAPWSPQAGVDYNVPLRDPRRLLMPPQPQAQGPVSGPTRVYNMGGPQPRGLLPAATQPGMAPGAQFQMPGGVAAGETFVPPEGYPSLGRAPVAAPAVSKAVGPLARFGAGLAKGLPYAAATQAGVDLNMIAKQAELNAKDLASAQSAHSLNYRQIQGWLQNQHPDLQQAYQTTYGNMLQSARDTAGFDRLPEKAKFEMDRMLRVEAARQVANPELGKIRQGIDPAALTRRGGPGNALVPWAGLNDQGDMDMSSAIGMGIARNSVPGLSVAQDVVMPLLGSAGSTGKGLLGAADRYLSGETVFPSASTAQAPGGLAPAAGGSAPITGADVTAGQSKYGPVGPYHGDPEQMKQQWDSWFRGQMSPGGPLGVTPSGKSAYQALGGFTPGAERGKKPAAPVAPPAANAPAEEKQNFIEKMVYAAQKNLADSMKPPSDDGLGWGWRMGPEGRWVPKTPQDSYMESRMARTDNSAEFPAIERYRKQREAERDAGIGMHQKNFESMLAVAASHGATETQLEDLRRRQDKEVAKLTSQGLGWKGAALRERALRAGAEKEYQGLKAATAVQLRGGKKGLLPASAYKDAIKELQDKGIDDPTDEDIQAVLDRRTRLTSASR